MTKNKTKVQTTVWIDDDGDPIYCLTTKPEEHEKKVIRTNRKLFKLYGSKMDYHEFGITKV